VIPRIVFVSLFAGLLAGQPAPAPDPAVAGRQALDLLLAQKYAELERMFTPEVADALPEAALKGVGGQIQSLGAPQSIGQPQRQAAGELTMVLISVTFAQVELVFQFSLTADGKIAGMHFRPSSPPSAAWERPLYSKPDAFRERDVTVGDDEWKLPGTLSVPTGSGRFPGVVLVHGSGPNDRDETVEAVKVFKDLAEGLASRGVAVLRYEKRTKQYPEKMRALKTVHDETIDDAVRAGALLRAQPEVDPKRVFVLGHSLGGNQAPRIGQVDDHLAGLIILAGPVRPLEDFIVEQGEYLGAPPQTLAALRAQVAQVKALRPGDENAPAALNAPASYWLDLKGYDPAALAKTLTIPMLILQGERDYQVSMKDFALWKSALGDRSNVTLKAYPTLNHLFVAGEGKSLPAEYSKPGHVAPEVIDDIVAFVTK
jgi:dienelactone hydrolase